MKVDISIPVDDVPVVRAALNERYSYVSGAISNTVGYPGNERWRAERDAIERVLNAMDAVAPEARSAK